jgi:hypothetical protein
MLTVLSVVFLIIGVVHSADDMSQVKLTGPQIAQEQEVDYE